MACSVSQWRHFDTGLSTPDGTWRPLSASGGAAFGREAAAQREVLGSEQVGRGQDAGALDAIREFADVAGPGVRLEDPERFLGNLEAEQALFDGEFR